MSTLQFIGFPWQRKCALCSLADYCIIVDLRPKWSQVFHKKIRTKQEHSYNSYRPRLLWEQMLAAIFDLHLECICFQCCSVLIVSHFSVLNVLNVLDSWLEQERRVQILQHSHLHLHGSRLRAGPCTKQSMTTYLHPHSHCGEKSIQCLMCVFENIFKALNANEL